MSASPQPSGAQDPADFGLTAIVVSHDVPEAFSISDRVAFMHRGKMKLVGTVDEVMASRDEDIKQFLAGRAAGDDLENNQVSS
jgi:phospholipid/cholesterol/gamma-HCH transport system ATP-binding protein